MCSNIHDNDQIVCRPLKMGPGFYIEYSVDRGLRSASEAIEPMRETDLACSEGPSGQVFDRRPSPQK